jgi:hypothetical protein
LLFDPEVGGCSVLRNIFRLATDYMTPHKNGGTLYNHQNDDKDISVLKYVIRPPLWSVVRVLGYRSGALGSIPGTARKKSSGSGTGST